MTTIRITNVENARGDITITVGAYSETHPEESATIELPADVESSLQVGDEITISDGTNSLTLSVPYATIPVESVTAQRDSSGITVDGYVDGGPKTLTLGSTSVTVTPDSDGYFSHLFDGLDGNDGDDVLLGGTVLTQVAPSVGAAGSAQTLIAHGGGTHNAIAFSPDGSILVAFADVGATRYFLDGETEWRYLPTRGNNASRQVAGGCVTNDGIVYQVVGNFATAGELQRIDINTGAVTRLVGSLNVLANGKSVGDAFARPRPAGWFAAYDETADVVYYCTEAGVGRYNVGTSTDDGIVALAGVVCRGFAHTEHMILDNADVLYVCTRTEGLVRLSGIQGTVVEDRISFAGWTRFEDAVVLPDGTVLGAGLERGLLWCQSGSASNNDVVATNVTPSQASGTGASGGTTYWNALAISTASGTVAAGTVNPDGGAEWIYREADAATLDSATWEDATPTPATLALGSTTLSPTNRLLGESGGSGADLVGTYAMAFDPSDATGNTLVTTGTLSLYRSTNFAGTLANITFSTHNNGLSMLAVSDAHFDADGNLIIAVADHNAYTWDAADLLTTEPTRASVDNIRDGWSVTSVGSGADKVTVFCPADDKVPGNSANDFVYHRGANAPAAWTTTGYKATHNGRVGGICGWDVGNGTYKFVGWADGLGWLRSTYTLATDSWSAWQTQATGPTSTSPNMLQERQIIASSDGAVIFGIELSNGQLWRSINGGANWTQIAATLGSNSDQRLGRIAYLESVDVLAYSDKDGLHKIANASTSASVSTISGISTPCMLAADSTDRLYAHVRGPGPADLMRFDTFASATTKTDGTQIGQKTYRDRTGDLACTMTIGVSSSIEYIVTGYQGSGAYVQALPS